MYSKRYFSVFLLFLWVGWSCSPSEETILFHDFQGYTFQSDTLRSFSVLVVQGGKVAHIGENRTAAENLFPSAKKRSLKGATVLPGLIDAHGHVAKLGFTELDVDLAHTRSLGEALETIQTFADNHPDLPWITGRGWNHVNWGMKEFPDKSDLDALDIERPIWLNRVDGHAAWGNSVALQKANISKETLDPIGGKVIKTVNGTPTGIFIDKAMSLVQQHIPERSKKEWEEAITLALKKLRALGITSAHDAGIGTTEAEIFQRLAKSDSLTTRIYAMIGGTGAAFDALSEQGPILSLGNDTFIMRSVKLYQDGALGSRGAALIEPYSDAPGTYGLPFNSEEELFEMYQKAVAKGYQVNTHAIGDKANRMVLSVIEKVLSKFEVPDPRYRIEHAQIMHPDDIERFRSLKVIASMQPTHATSDMNMAEDRVGPQRILSSYAWKTFINHDVVVASGSDFPVENANPFFGLYSAVTRQDHKGMPLEGWYAQESLTREEALRSFTIDAAYAGFQEKVTGSLEPGKWADFIVIDTDYFTCDASQIWKIQVLETWLGGKNVYSHYEN